MLKIEIKAHISQIGHIRNLKEMLWKLCDSEGNARDGDRYDSDKDCAPHIVRR